MKKDHVVREKKWENPVEWENLIETVAWIIYN